MAKIKYAITNTTINIYGHPTFKTLKGIIELLEQDGLDYDKLTVMTGCVDKEDRALLEAMSDMQKGVFDSSKDYFEGVSSERIAEWLGIKLEDLERND